MYGESLNALEVVLAGFILIVLPFLIGLSIEMMEELNRGNRRK